MGQRLYRKNNRNWFIYISTFTLWICLHASTHVWWWVFFFRLFQFPVFFGIVCRLLPANGKFELSFAWKLEPVNSHTKKRDAAQLSRLDFANRCKCLPSKSKVLRAHWDFRYARRRRRLILEFHLNKLVKFLNDISACLSVSGSFRTFFSVVGSINSARPFRLSRDISQAEGGKIGNISIGRWLTNSVLFEIIDGLDNRRKSTFFCVSHFDGCTRQRGVIVVALHSRFTTRCQNCRFRRKRRQTSHPESIKYCSAFMCSRNY